MRRVLLTDDLEEVLDDLTNALGDHFQVYTCQTGRGLTEVIENFRPDLLVLDLSMPGYDPFDVLRSIQNQNIQIVATCLGVTDYLAQLLDELGVRWLMVKPIQSAVMAVRLLELELLLDDPPDRAIRSAVNDLLLQAGVPLRRTGYRPLAESIVFAVADPECSMVDRLYPHVAQICGTTAGSVDISMRRCIEQTFKFRKPYAWKRLFGSSATEKCPSNSAFIKQLAHIVRKQLHFDT